MSQSHPSFFFSATQSVDDRLGDLFSFTWASYAGFRDLWWQVRGFKKEFPSLHIKEIEKKFLSGLPLPGGIDLNQMCLQTEWTQHESEFAKWLLFEACTLYEGWAEKVCKDLFSSTTWERNAKRLQFPSGVRPNGNPDGYPLVIAVANGQHSQLMQTEFFPKLKAAKLNVWPTINHHLIAYRYFKECRNAYIHSEGHASQEVIDLQTRLEQVQNAGPSPFRHNFNLPPQVVGEKIKLDTRDCILFATLVRKMMCTFDAALSVAEKSEEIMERRLTALIAKSPKWQHLPGDPVKKAQRVQRMLSASRIPAPTNLSNVMLWMQSKGML